MHPNLSVPGLRARGRDAAFTLIELLVVVAIIAILAAVAVPNFLEAQTRARVSTTQSDLRTLAAALEAYRVDANRYPKALLSEDLGARLRPLTTPVAFISALPRDPFWTPGAVSIYATAPFYVYCSGNLYAGGASVLDTAQAVGTIWSLAGRGPDRDVDGGVYCVAHPLAIQSRLAIRTSYDPTNGTVSNGDLYRTSPGSLGDRL